MKRFSRILAYVLLGLLILIGVVYSARVPLVNFGLRQIPPELGVQASIESMDLSLLRRSVFIGGIRAKLQEPDLELAIADIALTGIVVHSLEEAGFEALHITQVDATFKDAEQTIHAQVGDIGLKGVIARGTEDAEFETLNIKQVNVKLQLAADTINAQVSGIELSGANYLSGDVNLEQLAVNGVATQLSQWPAPDVSVADLVVKKIEYLAAGQVNVASVALSDVATQAKALEKNVSIKQLDLDGIQFVIETLGTKLASVVLNGLIYADATAGDQPPMVNLNTLTISGIDVPKPTSIHINNIVFPGGELYVERNAEGQINLVPPMPEDAAATQEASAGPESADATEQDTEASQQANTAVSESAEAQAAAEQGAVAGEAGAVATEAQAVASNEEEPLSWSLLGFQLEAPLTIHFSDFSVVPVLKETITFKEVSLAHAHNAASGEPLTAKILADIGKAGKLDLKASALVATASDSFDVDLDLDHFELGGLSGFSQQATGYAIESGQVSLHVKMQARKRQLDGEAIADLYRVVLRVEEAETSEKLTQELSMPLPTALYLLQDDDERIELKIPIEGDMDSPSFSPSGFMALVTKKALKKASLYYLKNTLFPGNLLIDAVSLVGGSVYAKFTAVPPMEFTPASPELSPANMQTLEQLVELLGKKKKLSVRLCSVAVPADGVDKAAALQLADQRSELARQWLLERQVVPSRLLSCLSRYDEKAEKPMLLMQL